MKALGAVAYLVKPLDVGQIVPAVDAAFARLRGQRAAAEAQRQAPARAAGGRALADLVPLAVGVLMHRYSLSRGERWRACSRMADAAGVPLAEQAERLVGRSRNWRARRRPLTPAASRRRRSARSVK